MHNQLAKMKRFVDKVTIVTGGAQGIGRAIALRFAEEGSNVVIADVNLEGAEKVVQEIRGLGKQALAIKTDVSNREEVNRMVNSAVEKFGKIDILVNDAGIVLWKLMKDTEEKDWDNIYNVNIKGVFLCTQAVVKQMIGQKNGKIINIASLFGKFGVKLFSAYNSSKAAVINFTKTSALELAPYNITVNAICPGDTMTPMMQAEIVTLSKQFGISEEEYSKRAAERIPLGRFGTPQDIAGLAAFLASDEASWITGGIFDICGGEALSIVNQ